MWESLYTPSSRFIVKSIPFLDTLVVRKDDGSVKLLVYRKTTHTDQYLNFQSHHPLHHKLGVIRTLLNRCNSIVSEEEDRKQEETHVKEALQKCGYPKWTMKKVKQQMDCKDEKRTQQRKSREDKDRYRGLVVLPYVKGLSESVDRVMRKHRISTAMRPHQTIRSMLVHPKDKVNLQSKCNLVYSIPCQNCDKVYIGETGRNFRYRLEEHKKDVNTHQLKNYTRSERTASLSDYNKSGITDHSVQQNHMIDWEGAKAVDRESHLRTRQVKEAIQIRKHPTTMNRDEGAYRLSHIWDPVFRQQYC